MNAQFFFKKKLFRIIQYTYYIIICLRCEYQFSTNIIQKNYNITHNTKIMVILHIQDPLNIITQSVKKELYLNNISVINNLYDNHPLFKDLNQKIFLFKILNISENRIPVSVFQNGTESEYQIILKINAEYCNLKNKKNCQPINIQICRTLMRDPNKILPNFIQENEMLEIIRVDAAQQLIQKFLMQLQD